MVFILSHNAFFYSSHGFHLNLDVVSLRFRWNNYIENNRKALRGEQHMQPELFKHFAADNHSCFWTDCSITLIDKTDGSDPTRREEYWRKVLKTVAPYGLNTLS